MKKQLILGFLLFALVGCATAGRQFDLSATEQIKIGLTTKEEVIVIMGPPLSTTKMSDGHTHFGYVYVHAAIGYPTIQQIFSVTIGPDGKVENTTTSTTNL